MSVSTTVQPGTTTPTTAELELLVATPVPPPPAFLPGSGADRPARPVRSRQAASQAVAAVTENRPALPSVPPPPSAPRLPQDAALAHPTSAAPAVDFAQRTPSALVPPGAVPQDHGHPAASTFPLADAPSFTLPAHWVRWAVAEDADPSVAGVPSTVALDLALPAMRHVHSMAQAAGQVDEAALWFPSRDGATAGMTSRAFPSRHTARHGKRTLLRTARRTPEIPGARVLTYSWAPIRTAAGPGVLQDVLAESDDGAHQATTLRCTVFSATAPVVLVLEFFTLGHPGAAALEKDVVKTLTSLR